MQIVECLPRLTEAAAPVLGIDARCIGNFRRRSHDSLLSLFLSLSLSSLALYTYK